MPIEMKEEDPIYWDDVKHSLIKRNFHFSATSMLGGGTSEEDDYQKPSMKQKITVTRDPMSHRIIEKRRRDRMNNCLADLSRLIPAEYLKKGRGRIEKTEIIEMAIKHMKYLQSLTSDNSADHPKDKSYGLRVDQHQPLVNNAKMTTDASPDQTPRQDYKLGYQECVAETMRFLVERQGFIHNDALCVKVITHLQKYYEKLSKGDKLISTTIENCSTNSDIQINRFRAITISGNCSDHDCLETTLDLTTTSTPLDSDDSSQENNSFSGGTCINGCSRGPSQLRDMLVSPRLSSLYVPTMKSDRKMQYSPPQNDSGVDNYSSSSSSSGSSYKFKNYIRERFEHSNLDKALCKPRRITSNGSSMQQQVSGTNKRTSNNLDDTPSKYQKLLRHYHSHQSSTCATSHPVPVFALHSKGSFYVPLTVDSHMLAPFVAELTRDYGIHGFSKSVLVHPVTISVNFNRPSSQQIMKPAVSSTNVLASAAAGAVSFTSGLHNETPFLMVPGCS